jgi:hypothetical protein
MKWMARHDDGAKKGILGINGSGIAPNVESQTHGSMVGPFQIFQQHKSNFAFDYTILH